MIVPTVPASIDSQSGLRFGPRESRTLAFDAWERRLNIFTPRGVPIQMNNYRIRVPLCGIAQPQTFRLDIFTVHLRFIREHF